MGAERIDIQDRENPEVSFRSPIGFPVVDSQYGTLVMTSDYSRMQGFLPTCNPP